jgi:alkylation response protein AidB-like acyl-CoA dehydrogenase
MVLKRKNKNIPKLASGEWFEPTALLNQELDLMPTQENKSVLSEDGKYYSITGQKISNAGFCSLFIVFARIGDDKILLVSS